MMARGLTRDEATALLWKEFACWNNRCPAIEYLDELLPGQRIEFDRALRHNYGMPGVARTWYESMKPLLDPHAVRYIDGLMAQPG
jgi:hypothetical protein